MWHALIAALLPVTLGIVGLLIVGGVVLLIVPVRVTLAASIGTGQAGPISASDGGGRRSPPVRLTIRWLMFEWNPDPPGRAPVARQAPVPGRRSQAPAAQARRQWRRARAALTSPGFCRRFVRLILDVARALRPKVVTGWIRIGAGDPADTGMLVAVWHGVVHPTLQRMACSTAWDLRFEPDFVQAGVATTIRANWVVRPVTVLAPVVAFIVSPVTLRAGFVALRTA